MNIYEILAPSGRERAMAEYIKEKAEAMGYICRFDTFGNLICGDGEITIECGMDTVSFMKTAETDSGMIKIAVPNKATVKMLAGKKVRFLNGRVGVVRCDKIEDAEDFDLSVDIGLSDKESAKNAVPVGEFGAVVCDEFETENFVFGNGISSYIPIIVLLEVMEKVKDKAAFVFTAGRRFGGRGLKALLGDYDAKTLISVNTTAEKSEIKCQKGVAVVIKEKGAVPNVDLRQELIASADRVQLLYEEDNLYLDLPQIYGKGAKAGGICIPVRDKDGTYEAVSKSDIKDAAEFLINYLKKVN